MTVLDKSVELVDRATYHWIASTDLPTFWKWTVFVVTQRGLYAVLIWLLWSAVCRRIAAGGSDAIFSAANVCITCFGVILGIYSILLMWAKPASDYEDWLVYILPRFAWSLLLIALSGAKLIARLLLVFTVSAILAHLVITHEGQKESSIVLGWLLQPIDLLLRTVSWTYSEQSTHARLPEMIAWAFGLLTIVFVVIFEAGRAYCASRFKRR